MANNLEVHFFIRCNPIRLAFNIIRIKHVTICVTSQQSVPLNNGQLWLSIDDRLNNYFVQT